MSRMKLRRSHVETFRRSGLGRSRLRTPWCRRSMFRGSRIPRTNPFRGIVEQVLLVQIELSNRMSVKEKKRYENCEM
jgi:hypothetical protein